MTKFNFDLKNVAITIACFAVSSLLLVSGCKKDDKKDDNPTLTGIEFDKPAISIAVNGTYDLKVVPVPSKAELPTCTFVSDNEGIAKVNSAGTVTGVAKGKATITATAGGFTAKCTVTVTDGTEPPLTGISFESEGSDNITITLQAGGAYEIAIVPVPADAILPELTFASSNSNIATVSNTGRVDAVAEGTATITVTADKFTAQCVVTVAGNVVGPLYFIEPCLLFGSSHAEIKACETRKLKSEMEYQLMYEGDNEDVAFVRYAFYGGMILAGVGLDDSRPQIEQRMLDFLNSKYTFIESGSDPLYLFKTDEGGRIEIYHNNGYWHVEYF